MQIDSSVGSGVDSDAHRLTRLGRVLRSASLDELQEVGESTLRTAQSEITLQEIEQRRRGVRSDETLGLTFVAVPYEVHDRGVALLVEGERDRPVLSATV